MGPRSATDATRDRLVREIAGQWALGGTQDLDDRLPAFLHSPLLVDLVGQHSNTVVQVLDTPRWKSVYVSPNITAVTGFTPEENNRRGVLDYFRQLTLSEVLFQVKNAYLIGRVGRTMPPRTAFHSVLLNSSIQTKRGERRRIVTQLVTIEWTDKGAPRYQLVLWRDATNLFEGHQTVSRHEWQPPGRAPVCWSYHSDRERFVEQDLLSPREREVIARVERGESSKQIAAALELSTGTVENHRKNALRRLQLRTTDGLVEICKWMRWL